MTSRRRTSLSTLSTASSSPSGPADSDDSDSDAYSDSSWNTEQEELEAQLQWEESVRQLQALVNLVAVPWVSRYFGRKWAYWRALQFSFVFVYCGADRVDDSQSSSGISTSG